MKTSRRWWRFNAVGLAGFAVQLLVLAFLVRVLGLHYIIATALAVEAAVLHNFFWHERWTWADRCAGAVTVRMKRLLLFHATNGAASLLGNLAVVSALVSRFGVPVIPANLAAVLICSLLNFLLGHHLVFQSRGHATWRPSAAPLRSPGWRPEE